MAGTSAPTADRRSVFVIDDDRSVCRALGRLLTSFGYPVETFQSAEQFLESGRLEDAGCLIVDLRLPGLDGRELQKRIATDAPGVPVVFLSGQSDVPTGVQAMKEGAIDFLTKPVEAQRLVEVVDEALNTGSRNRSNEAELASIRARVNLLTARERQVMHLVASGMLNKQIAYHLGTSEKTIKVHRSRVVEKLQVSSVAELVRLVDRMSASDGS